MPQIPPRLLVRVLGALFFAVGLVGLALMLVAASAAAGMIPFESLTTGPMQQVLARVGTLITIIFPVYLVVGGGLLVQAFWARPLAFAAAMMSVFSFPVGTFLALFTFAVLARSESKALFVRRQPLVEPGKADAAALREVDRMAAMSDASVESTAAIVLEYSVTPDDLVAFAEYHAAHSPAARSHYYWSLASGTILVLLLLWAYGFRTIGGWSGAIVAVIGWWVYLNWRTADATRRYYRRAYSEGSNRGVLGVQRLSADADGLRATTEVTDTRVSWSVVERIVSEPGFALIYIGALNAYVIPTARVVKGDVLRFIESVRLFHAEAAARTLSGNDGVAPR